MTDLPGARTRAVVAVLLGLLVLAACSSTNPRSGRGSDDPAANPRSATSSAASAARIAAGEASHPTVRSGASPSLDPPAKSATAVGAGAADATLGRSSASVMSAGPAGPSPPSRAGGGAQPEHRPSARSATPPAPPVSAGTGTARLTRAYPVSGSCGCHLDPDGDATVVYRAVLEVTGPAARHDWRLAIPFAEAENHSAAAVSTRSIRAGRELVFETSIRLDGPDRQPVQVVSEDVIDADSNPPSLDFTRLAYPNHGVLITGEYCR